jgi:hypothetical protein
MYVPPLFFALSVVFARFRQIQEMAMYLERKATQKTSALSATEAHLAEATNQHSQLIKLIDDYNKFNFAFVAYLQLLFIFNFLCIRLRSALIEGVEDVEQELSKQRNIKIQYEEAQLNLTRFHFRLANQVGCFFSNLLELFLKLMFYLG